MLLITLAFLVGCQSGTDQPAESVETSATPQDLSNFKWQTERVEDKRILRYQINGFDQLSLQQKKLVYYLTQAGLAGRDMMWDMNYRHNLTIRRALENIVRNYKGDQTTEDWNNFMTYTKNIWFSNGIHHHYSTDKFIPAFSKEYFLSLCEATETAVPENVLEAMFNPDVDAKKINLDPEKDLVMGSAVNFYDPDITAAEVDAFYGAKLDPENLKPVSIGLNSKLVRKDDGSIEEKVWKTDGMYGEAIREVVKWLEKAVGVAENEAQANALKLLIEYYQTGDLAKWDAYNIAWVQATEGDIDYLTGFIEVYNDPKGYKGSYETIVQIKDFEASERMQTVANNAQWFESNSPILDAHKKENVVGISYNVVAVAGESGDASPATPIGVNLPNSDWIRAEYGSKSVSLGSILDAYNNAEGPGLVDEFSNDPEEIERAGKYSQLAGKIHTALHEVVGHASGKLEPGVATPKETLQSYASPLEEARADLVALYYIMDPKLVELGLMESLDVGKAEYDQYIKNGLMLQLRRIVPGKNIEQAHMRNRQMVAGWAFEKGKADHVISKVTRRDGKTYYEINDYDKLRGLFGDLLKEVQRIKSQGDYEAGRDLIENYGVQVDPVIHAEVLERSAKLDIPPYSGFINPVLVPVKDAQGNITNIQVEYPDDFKAQMLFYAEQYSFLPNYN
ncbi:MAG: dihydrofolate reductase [Phaeodactylibacter sp.]|nr:dihydrofolate reductase [Phaeodactylibacter sp.]